jgi:hypothetical protein
MKYIESKIAIRHPRLAISVVASFLAAFVLAAPLSATAQVNRGETQLVPVQRSYDLKIVSISPVANLVENQPIQVRYQLSVGVFGVLGTLSPKSGMVCPKNNKGSCTPIAELAPGSHPGTINAFAPPASAASKISIKLVDSTATCPTAPNCNEVLLSESEPLVLAAAATYDISIDRFIVHRPRSKCKDTVKISLFSALQNGDRANMLCLTPGANYCAALVEQGDHGTGDSCGLGAPHHDDIVAVHNVRVGPYRLVPEVSENILFDFVVMNLGEPYAQTATITFLNFMAQGAAGVLNATANGGTFDTLAKWSETIHGLAACDGPVASGTVPLLNTVLPAAPGAQTLDALTQVTGRLTGEFSRIEGVNSAPGCGENSLYSVTWSVIRTSWQP